VYNYNPEWKTDVVNSGNFHVHGHSNPSSMPYEHKTIIGDLVNLGEFELA
jgi:hypothetical protein